MSLKDDTVKLSVMIASGGGERVEIEACLSMKLKDLKGLLYEKTGIAPEYQRLLYMGRELTVAGKVLCSAVYPIYVSCMSNASMIGLDLPSVVSKGGKGGYLTTHFG